MLSSIQEAIWAFQRNPNDYVYVTFLAGMFCLLTVLGALGIFVLLFFLFSVLNMPIISLQTAVAVGIIMIWVLWMLSGVHAARINFYNNLLNNKRYGLRSGLVEFLNCAMQNASAFFLLLIIRFVIVAIPVTILYFLYDYLTQYNIPYLNIIIILLAMICTFIIHFLFSPIFILMGVYRRGIGSAFWNGGRILIRTHVKALALYFVYAITWVLNFVPLINLTTIFVIYPITNSSLISLYKKNA